MVFNEMRNDIEEKDIMPLIHHHELKKNNKSIQYIVEIIAAILTLIKN